MFKRSPSLVEQVKLHLKQRIINAEFNSGRIPSETDLASELNVSRNTIRDALGRLEIEGAIIRKQGAGTFVNQANLLVKTRLQEIIPYDTLIREHGYTPTITLAGLKKQPTDATLKQLLNLTPNDQLLIVQKLFLADDKPVIFTQTCIPANIIIHPYTPDDLQLPVFDFLPKFCRQMLAHYLTDIVPLIPPPWLAEHLHLRAAPNTALLSFDETGYNQDNRPIIKSTSYFRDDLLRLRMMRRYAP